MLSLLAPIRQALPAVFGTVATLVFVSRILYSRYRQEQRAIDPLGIHKQNTKATTKPNAHGSVAILAQAILAMAFLAQAT